jgi:hypothetical protein
VYTYSAINLRRRKESHYMCSECGAGLGVVPYFEQYHTKKKFLKDKNKEVYIM